MFLLKCLLVIRPWHSEEERKKSFLWWCQPSTKNYNTTDEDEQVRTVQDMAERLARVEQSLLEIHASMKEQQAAVGPAMSVKAGTSMSRWR
eukprot:symbB.v1.2.003148.t1/scaffold177.1/size287523/13